MKIMTTRCKDVILNKGQRIVWENLEKVRICDGTFHYVIYKYDGRILNEGMLCSCNSK